LDKRDELPSIREWKDSFRKLTEMAREQLRFLEQAEVDWQNLLRLCEQWPEVQRQAEDAAQSVRASLGPEACEKLFDGEIKPLAEEARRLTASAVEQMQTKMALVGEVLRDMRDRRAVMHAYYGMYRSNPTAYYFDEKK